MQVLAIAAVIWWTAGTEPCDQSSGLLFFCWLHIALRLADLGQFWAQHRHPLLYTNPLGMIDQAAGVYKRGRFWIYCASYALGRYVLLLCQRCVSPKLAGDSWWVSPSLASPLGVVAHIFIWVDTVVWLAWLAARQLQRVRKIVDRAPAPHCAGSPLKSASLAESEIVIQMPPTPIASASSLVSLNK